MPWVWVRGKLLAPRGVSAMWPGQGARGPGHAGQRTTRRSSWWRRRRRGRRRSCHGPFPHHSSAQHPAVARGRAVGRLTPATAHGRRWVWRHGSGSERRSGGGRQASVAFVGVGGRAPSYPTAAGRRRGQQQRRAVWRRRHTWQHDLHTYQSSSGIGHLHLDFILGHPTAIPTWTSGRCGRLHAGYGEGAR